MARLLSDASRVATLRLSAASLWNLPTRQMTTAQYICSRNSHVSSRDELSLETDGHCELLKASSLINSLQR
jgi:hypothetical protein